MGNYYAFVTDSSDGLRVLDITNPLAPAEVGYFDSPGVAVDIWALGGYLFLADAESGLWTLQFGEVDLEVTNEDGREVVLPGRANSYRLAVSNAGPEAVAGVLVHDQFPPTLEGVTWICGATPGSSCPAGSGSGTIQTLIDLLPDGRVAFTATGTISALASGWLTNTVTVTVPIGVTELAPESNQATDVDRVTVAQHRVYLPVVAKNH
jgi:uncharacterized repeat protein (TIGR01451 family)